jgi:hypothetical protein
MSEVLETKVSMHAILMWVATGRIGPRIAASPAGSVISTRNVSAHLREGSRTCYPSPVHACARRSTR